MTKTIFRKPWSCMVWFWLSLSLLTGFTVQAARGQTFLEKLEAAVRERLSDPPLSLEPAETAKPESATEQAEEIPLPGEAASVAPPEVLPERPPAAGPVPAPAPPPGPHAPPAAPAQALGRPYLGLEAAGVTGGGIGVNVTAVTEGSPAWKAGFEVGDRIVAVDGFAIGNMDALVEQLGKTAPGDTVKFFVSRNGRNVELIAVLMDAGLAEQISGEPLPLGDLSGPPWLGVMVNDLTASFRNQFGISAFRAAAVTQVAFGSPAYQAGIRPGDAIYEINGRPIEAARDLLSWMATARPGQRAEIAYYRGITPATVTLTLGVQPSSQPARTTGRPAVPVPTDPVLDPAPAAVTPPQVAPPVAENTPQVPPSDGLAAQLAVERAERAERELAELRAENERLQLELRKSTARLNEVQSRLEGLLQSLSGTAK